MAVYRPTYRDKETNELKDSTIWWYNFTFAGRRIQESSKSARKTVAQEAEKKRRLELERAFNDVTDRRRDRIRTVSEVATEFLGGYGLRNPKSATFAEYAIGHVTRLIGSMMVVGVGETAVKDYQTARLKEKAAPKSINEEVGFLLRMLEDQGDAIRVRLRRQNALKLTVGRRIARAFTPDEKAALLEAALARRSPCIYPALMLALHAGMRDGDSCLPARHSCSRLAFGRTETSEARLGTARQVRASAGCSLPQLPQQERQLIRSQRV